MAAVTGLVTWLAAGVVVAVAGKLLLPGEPLGWPAALGLGVGGGVAGGLVATAMAMGGSAELDPRSATIALLSAALVLIVAQVARTRRRGPSS